MLVAEFLLSFVPPTPAVTVALNSILQILLYSPLAMLYLGPQYLARAAGFWLVAKSVLIFLGVPLVLGIIIRFAVIYATSRSFFENTFMKYFGPVALISLIYTIIGGLSGIYLLCVLLNDLKRYFARFPVLFAAQGPTIVSQIGNVARVAVPFVIYFSLMWAIAIAASWYFYAPYAYAVTQSFTAASNNFELAIAVAVATFGVDSEQALAATVGPLVEVPVLLALVHVVRWVHSRWYAERDEFLYSTGKVKLLEHEIGRAHV